jgi:hypothetical protein
MNIIVPLTEYLAQTAGLNEDNQLTGDGKSGQGTKDEKLQMEKTPSGLSEHGPHEKAVNEGLENTGLGNGSLVPENTGFPIPEIDEAILEGVVRDELAAQNKVLEYAEGGEWGISLCSSQMPQGEEREGPWLDTLSNGGSDQLEQEETEHGGLDSG